MTAIEPDTIEPTPEADILALSSKEREIRVQNLITQSHEIVKATLDEHTDGHTIMAKVALFSGGGDSTVLTHVMRETCTHVAHINTGIGIEQTREFVRDTCKDWGLPLIEKHPPVTYRELVLERGFPGPGMHWKMYTRLKERCLDQVRRDFVIKPRQQRILFLAGRRRSESQRRAQIPLNERRGSVIWCSPIAFWTKLDLNTYRAMYKVPLNPVSACLHMSGECLCGAFAKPGELDEIGFWYPEMKAEIQKLEAEVRAAGHPEPLCIWGNRQGKPSKSGALCSDCEVNYKALSKLDFL